MILRYAHLAPSHKVKAVDMLDNTLKGNQEKITDEMYAAQLLHSPGVLKQKSTGTTVQVLEYAGAGGQD